MWKRGSPGSHTHARGSPRGDGSTGGGRGQAWTHLSDVPQGSDYFRDTHEFVDGFSGRGCCPAAVSQTSVQKPTGLETTRLTKGTVHVPHSRLCPRLHR